MSANPPSSDPKRWWALFLLCAAQFLVILDTSIVGIALPALQRALGFDAAGLQWIFNAYVVAFGGLLLLALGFCGASAAAGGTAGVFLGGVITEWLSWRWTFLVNVPVGSLVLLATTAWLPRGQRQSGRVDILGGISITSGLGLAVYAS